jgi:hypothetical protein
MRVRSRPVHIRLLVDKTALGQVILTAVRFVRVGMIPHTLHSLLHLRVNLTRRINE